MGLSQPKDYKWKNMNPREVILTGFNSPFNIKWNRMSFLTTLRRKCTAKTLYSSHQGRRNKATFLIDLASSMVAH